MFEKVIIQVTNVTDEDVELIAKGRGYKPDPTFEASYDECFKIYDAIWQNMDRENSLINQRISWSLWLTAGFLTAETFLLGQVLSALTRPAGPTRDMYYLIAMSCAVCVILSGIAAYFCHKTRIGVAAAHTQLNYLKRRYYRLKVGDKRLFQDEMRLPRPFGNQDDHHSGNIVAKTFPNVMCLIWILFCLLELGGFVLALVNSR